MEDDVFGEGSRLEFFFHLLIGEIEGGKVEFPPIGVLGVVAKLVVGGCEESAAHLTAFLSREHAGKTVAGNL
jgi:hypothetical protein